MAAAIQPPSGAFRVLRYSVLADLLAARIDRFTSEAKPTLEQYVAFILRHWEASRLLQSSWQVVAAPRHQRAQSRCAVHRWNHGNAILGQREPKPVDGISARRNS